METPRLCKEPRHTLVNTLQPQKLSRTATWHAPNWRVHNQIDVILTPHRFRSSINKVLGADIGSDHDLVLIAMTLKLKTKHFTKSPRIQFDLQKPKDPKTAAVFQGKVGGKFAALCVLGSDVDTLANSLKEGYSQ